VDFQPKPVVGRQWFTLDFSDFCVEIVETNGN